MDILIGMAIGAVVTIIGLLVWAYIGIRGDLF